MVVVVVVAGTIHGSVAAILKDNRDSAAHWDYLRAGMATPLLSSSWNR